jgi:hypothetical protein
VTTDESDPPLRDDSEREKEKKHLLERAVERAVPEVLKRFVERAVESGVGRLESGVERLQEGPENLRQFVGDLKLPKEFLQYLYTQIDDTKNGLYRVVAKEIRDVLEHTQFAEEITKVLTKLSFEIKTEIRFVPNTARRAPAADDDGEGDDGENRASGLPKPEVKAQVSVKDHSKEPRRERRRREEP